MAESKHEQTASPDPPEWRLQYMHNPNEALAYFARRRSWQLTSVDPFERADAYLWSQISGEVACQIFLTIDCIADCLPEHDREVTMRKLAQADILSRLPAAGIA